MIRGWAFFREKRRQARRKRLTPSLPALLMLAALAVVIVANVRVTAIAP